MAEDIINYSALIDDAMHIIVRESLKIVSKTPLRLLGEHHFFISFLTRYPGVSLSKKLLDKYPEEMTIVLQYQFEELIVNDQEFSVTLSFDNVKEKIVIPFKAITAFTDPSVKFGLQFRHVSENFEQQHKVIPNQQLETEQQVKEIIKASGATNIITLDNFRKK
jgi:hypothetical protein